ncbi:MAG: ThuA domain-containing protein [Candidatus Nealsonbacteria bacterium]|nr:ThuA domain-containing protein [Candidatus Nealsonbacteria bacterium]
MQKTNRALTLLILAITVTACLTAPAAAADPWVVYEGKEGPGLGKHIVLISGDEEYRSEEALPQLGKILAVHHGFNCTALFAVDPDSGEIAPNNQNNIPGTEALKTADLMVVALRFRDLTDDQMKNIVDYVEAGKPVLGMRTSTHSFKIPKGKTYSKYSNGYGGEEYTDGFGRQVLGEKWINHHGHHGREATLGLIVKGQEDHPILRGIKDGDIFGPTDVYGVRLPLPGDSKPLVLGQVLSGMQADTPPVEGKKNDPMMPVAWTKSYKDGRVFNTTMGAANDMNNEGMRRLLVNACYWCVGLEEKIPEKSCVDIVGEFKPSNFGFNGYVKGVKPSDHAMK